jgi:hypothetical protein
MKFVGGFFPGPPVSSTNKTDSHHITEMLLKVALNTIKQINKRTNKRIRIDKTQVKQNIN